MLIYNQNIQIPFANISYIAIHGLYEDEDIDAIFSEFIEKELAEENFDFLLIPFSLSENHVELLGLRLAYHIRLSLILGEKRNVPIILFDDLTPYATNKLSPLGEILFTEGVHYCKDNQTEIIKLLTKHQNGDLTGLIDRKKFIERIHIEAPANYGTSHHAITNEWAITRIAKAIGKEIEMNESEAFKQVKSLLYYKYLSEKYAIEQTNTFSLQLPITPIRILYIDDEYEKGWKELLKLLFPTNIIVDTLEINYKGTPLEQLEQIITEIETKVNSTEYDIILLDLRLHDADFQQNIAIQDITGYKALQKIREVANQGISVIIFTASNKAWNFRKLMDIGADGYFMKESIENSIDNHFTTENLSQFQQTLAHAIGKSKLLKPYWKLIAQIKSAITIQNKPTTKIRERIEERLDMFWGLLKKGFERSTFDKELFHYSDYELAFLTLWSVFNEVQEGVYEKSETPDGKLTWSLVGTSDYFLNHNMTYIKDESTSTNRNPIPKYTVDTIDSSNKGLAKLIFPQIAYFLWKKRSIDNSSAYFTLFYQVQETRNHIYLTHGEATGSDFYKKTEQEKRDTTNINIHPYQGGEIVKLLNLMAFVLTGNNALRINDTDLPVKS